MKQKKLNSLISIFIAVAFIFVQLPLSMFHDHGHKTNCVYSGGSESGNKTAKHLHSNETKSCFVCEVSLVKDFVSVIPTSAIRVEVPQKYFSSSLISYSHSVFSLRSSRAPPIA